VRHDQTPIVEHEMADQAIDEAYDLVAELGRLPGKLRQRFGQAVRELHLAALQRPLQLVVVVAGHAEGRAGRDHVHRQPQHVGRARAAIDQIAEQD
jgi:hypothetical protein